MGALEFGILLAIAALLDLAVVVALRTARASRPPTEAPLPIPPEPEGAASPSAKVPTGRGAQAPVSRRQRTFLVAAGLVLLSLGCGLLWTTPAGALNLIVLVAGGITLAAGVDAGLAPTFLFRSGGWIDSLARWLGVKPWQVLVLAPGMLLAVAARSASGDQPRAIHPWYWLLWIAGIAVTVAGCWSAASAGRPAFRRMDLMALLVLAVVAFALRLPALEGLPHILRGDEGEVGLAGLEFIRGYRDNVLTTAWNEFPSLYFWIVSLGQHLFGRTAAAIRVASALAGGGAVLAVYAWSRSMFGRLTGFLAALLLASLDLHLVFSRVGLNNVIDTLSLTVALGALWAAWRTNDRRLFLLLGLALGLSPFFYVSARLIPVFVIGWLVVLRRLSPLRPRLPGLAASALVALSVSLPLGLFFLRFPQQWTGPIARVSLIEPEGAAILQGGDLLAITSGTVAQAWKTALGIASIPLIGFYEPRGPMLMLVPAALFIVGLGICLVRWKDPRSFILILGLAGSIASGSLSVEAPSSQRLLFATPFVAILVALPLGEGQALIARRRPRWSPVATALLICLTAALATWSVGRLLYQTLPRHAYWDADAELGTLGGRYLARLPRPLSVSFLGDIWVDHDTAAALPYLAGDVDWTDLRDPIRGADDLPLFAPNTVILALPPRFPELKAIREALPDGIQVDVVGDNGLPAFRALEYLR